MAQARQGVLSQAARTCCLPTCHTRSTPSRAVEATTPGRCGAAARAVTAPLCPHTSGTLARRGRSRYHTVLLELWGEVGGVEGADTEGDRADKDEREEGLLPGGVE